MNLPVELILTISTYLTIVDISILLEIFKDNYEDLSSKLIAWRYPKLFNVLNQPEIMGSGKIFESWDYIIGELVSYKYLLIDQKLPLNIQIQGVVLKHLLTDTILNYQNILSFIHQRILINFDQLFPRFNQLFPRFNKNSISEKERVIKSNYSVTFIVNTTRKLVEHNKTFMIKLLTILHRNDIGIVKVIQPSEFDLDVLIKLKIRLNDQLGSKILEHVIMNCPEYIQQFINYMNTECFYLLSIDEREEYVKSKEFKLEVISYYLLKMLLHNNDIKLFNLLVNHPDFKVTDGILTEACDDHNFQLLKVLVNHHSYKG